MKQHSMCCEIHFPPRTQEAMNFKISDYSTEMTNSQPLDNATVDISETPVKMEHYAAADIFPAALLSQPPAALPTHMHQAQLVALPDVVAFNCRLDRDHRLVFKSLRPRAPIEWTNGKFVDNFNHTYKQAWCADQKFQPDLVDFARLHERYSRPFRPLHNTDVRMGYAFNDNTWFLVKEYFTFGQRTVQPDEMHVVQTTASPVLFYRYDPDQPETRFKQRFVVQDRRFHPDDEFVYDRFVLRPETTYAVPPGTTYMLLTVRKTLMSVWKETCRDAYRSPTEERLIRSMQQQQQRFDEVAVYLSSKRRNHPKRQRISDEQPTSSSDSSFKRRQTDGEQQTSSSNSSFKRRQTEGEHQTSSDGQQQTSSFEQQQEPSFAWLQEDSPQMTCDDIFVQSPTYQTSPHLIEMIEKLKTENMYFREQIAKLQENSFV